MADAARRQQKTETLAKLYDGKLRLERRNGAARSSPAPTSRERDSSRAPARDALPAATKVATDWYLELRDRTRKGEHLHGRSFAAIAEAFISARQPASRGVGGPAPELPAEMEPPEAPLRRRQDRPMSTRDSCWRCGKRARRSQHARTGTPVKPATLKKDLDFVRLVLRHAKHIEKCLDDLPEFPSFRGEAWEVVPVAAPVPESRTMGQGAQARKGAHRRSRI